MIFFRFSGSCLFSSSRSPLPSPVPALRFLPGIRVLMSDLCGLRREMHARRRHAALPPARQRVERAPRPPVVFTDSHSVASEPEKSSPSIKNGHGKWLLHG